MSAARDADAGGSTGVRDGIGQQQRGRLPAVVVPEPQGGAGGEVGAGARAADGDPARVDAELRRAVADPADRGDDVVVRHRIGDARRGTAGSRR